MTVADTGLAADTPSLAVRDAYGGGVQEPSQEQVDSGTDAPLSFDVVLSKTSASAVRVDYATHNDTATAGADYVAEERYAHLPAGRDGEDRRGPGPARQPRRGQRDPEPGALERRLGGDRRRRGHRHDLQHRSDPEGVDCALRAHGGRADAGGG